MSFSGGCQCGAVRYRAARAPSEPHLCHCRMCQKAAGNYFMPLGGVAHEDFAITRGAISYFHSSDIVRRGFCARCGTPLTYETIGDDHVAITLGSLAGQSGRYGPIRLWGSVAFLAVVLAGGWGLARDSVNLALDGVPRGIELVDVKDYLGRLEGVTEVHDLHIWAMSTNETALTARLVRPGGYDDSFLHHVCEELAHRFNIHHATLQIESGSDVCKLAPAEVV